MSPIFYSLLSNVPAIEIVAHRSFWSTVFLFLYLILFSKVSLKLLFYSPREFFLLSASGILISINWYGFIYAVNSGNALQASLGYYIFPLVAVFLGYSFNKEEFTIIQFISKRKFSRTSRVKSIETNKWSKTSIKWDRCSFKSFLK